jgi:hypothetical protein
MRKFAVGAACTLAIAGGAAQLAFAEGSGRVPQSATAAASSDELAPATQALLNVYPGLQVYTVGGAVRAFYGKPMTAGATADEAVDAFWAAHRDAFGVTNLELTPFFSNDVSWNKFTVYAYKQAMGGLPVEYSVGRVLVLNGETNRVVYASGIFAQTPEGGFARAALSADQALAQVQSMLQYQQLSIWTAPQLVIFAGTEAEMAAGTFGSAVQAWKFTGDNGNLAARAKLTFFVDAASGRLITVRSEIQHVDVSGTVQGKGSPGMLPDIPANPAALMAMPEIRVSITGGSTVYGARDGSFTIPNGGSTSVTVTSSVANGATTGGRWVYVNNTPGAEITASTTATPPGPASLIYNNAPSALTTPQVNAFVHTNSIHNFISDRTSWTGMDFVMPANVNIASTCNAYYDGTSINFYQAGGGCSNTAYTSVIAHEYGHGIVNELGLSQGAFGEGFGDCCSELLFDDPVMGRNFQGSSPVRDYSPGQPEDLYPCSGSCGGEVHCCGEVIAGFWWDVREQYGTSPGLAEVQQLFVDWSQITNGGSGDNSAHPQTIIEILTVDDDNGDLADGTPHYPLICAAAAAHALPCPALSLVAFQFPAGIPTILTPSTATNIAVNVLPISATPTPGTGTVSYRVNGGSFTTIAMTQGSPNQYTASIPGAACGSRVDFYFSSGTSAGPASSPNGAPAASYASAAAFGTINVLTDDFQTNLGWTVGPGDTATTGIWTRVDPVGTSAQPENDHSAAGTICWVTGQGAVGGAVGDNDVDGGFTRLTSPALNFSGATGATVEYWRWYSNDQGASPNADTFRVEISNNGTTWVPLETVGPSGVETAGGWFFRSFNVSSFVGLTSNVRIRFTAEDAGSGSIVEAAVDDFRAYSLDCTPSAPCPGDLDGDGTIGLGDLTVLLSNFGTASGAGPEDGDMNADGAVDLTDLTAFLSLFGSTCP